MLDPSALSGLLIAGEVFGFRGNTKRCEDRGRQVHQD